MPSSRCRFAKHCPYYHKEHYTCQHDEEGVVQGYCGTAREFKRIEFVDVRDLR